MVASKNENYQQLMDTVYNTKLEIRKELGYKVGIVTMQKKTAEPNQIAIIDEKRNIKRCKRFDEEGVKYRLSHLDALHCPDPTEKVTLEELMKLYKKGIIQDKNLISPKMMFNIDKYKSCEFIGEKEEDYGER